MMARNYSLSPHTRDHTIVIMDFPNNSTGPVPVLGLSKTNDTTEDQRDESLANFEVAISATILFLAGKLKLMTLIFSN